MDKIIGLLVSIMAVLSVNTWAAADISSFSAIDIFSVHDKDLKSEKLGNAPRFAIVHPVEISPLANKKMVQVGENLVWTHEVKADMAVSLNFAFESFKLSANAELNIYAKDLSTSLRTFTAADNNAQNELWTPVIMSDHVVIELVVPAEEIQDVQFALTKINQGYRTFAQKVNDKSGSCNVDVMCSEGDDWRDEINSVAVISKGGSTFCTGFMVNNTNNDKAPLFMTAYHCGVREYNASSLVAYWNYQRPTCGSDQGGELAQFTTGAVHLASGRDSDFTLVKFNNTPDESFNVRYAGWDRRDIAPAKAIAIHHPATDEKSISFENDPTSLSTYLDRGSSSVMTHIKITDWDLGTTEPGSSGSPLFNDDHRVVGQLHGGYASCSSQTADWYGRLSHSWEGNGTESGALKFHSDPEDTGREVTDTL